MLAWIIATVERFMRPEFFIKYSATMVMGKLPRTFDSGNVARLVSIRNGKCPTTRLDGDDCKKVRSFLSSLRQGDPTRRE